MPRKRTRGRRGGCSTGLGEALLDLSEAPVATTFTLTKPQNYSGARKLEHERQKSEQMQGGGQGHGHVPIAGENLGASDEDRRRIGEQLKLKRRQQGNNCCGGGSGSSGEETPPQLKKSGSNNCLFEMEVEVEVDSEVDSE